MLWKIFLAFTIIPLVELYLLFRLAQATSLPATILLVIVTGFIGSVLARSQGMRAWRRFHAAIGEGRMPGQEIQEGLLIAFAAAMLLTPGLLTDVAGFALLIPVSREWIRHFLALRLKSRFHLQVGTFTQQPSRGDGEVVDAEGVRPVNKEHHEPALPPGKTEDRPEG